MSIYICNGLHKKEDGCTGLKKKENQEDSRKTNLE
jgi:hypothetical protein